MDRDPEDGLPPGVALDRRKTFRFPVMRPVVGHIVEVGQSATLQDISAGGFSAMAAVRLTLGAVYHVQFVLPPKTVDVRARLAYAMRVSGKQTSAHLLGFEFAEAARDEPAIAELIRQATGT